MGTIVIVCTSALFMSLSYGTPKFYPVLFIEKDRCSVSDGGQSIYIRCKDKTTYQVPLTQCAINVIKEEK